MAINYLNSDAGLEAIEAEIKSNGFVIVKDLIDKSAVEQIKSDLVPHLTPTPKKDKFAGRHTKRAGLVIASLKNDTKFVQAFINILSIPNKIFVKKEYKTF